MELSLKVIEINPNLVWSSKIFFVYLRYYSYLKTSYMTIIKDELLEPFFIGRDSYCYTVYEMVAPQRKHWAKEELGESYEKSHGHFSNFENAVKSILELKVNKDEKVFSSIKEYLNEWKVVKNEIVNVLKTN